MRIFVPLVVGDLACVELSPRLVHGVTRDLLQVFPRVDQEGLEYVATMAAADDSLRLLNPDGSLGFRRIVGVADVKNAMLALPAADEQLLETAVYLEQTLQISEFVSFLVDEPGNEALVSRAVEGDEAAFLNTEEIELLWYDAVEREALFRELSALLDVHD